VPASTPDRFARFDGMSRQGSCDVSVYMTSSTVGSFDVPDSTGSVMSRMLPDAWSYVATLAPLASATSFVRSPCGTIQHDAAVRSTSSVSAVLASRSMTMSHSRDASLPMTVSHAFATVMTVDHTSDSPSYTIAKCARISAGFRENVQVVESATRCVPVPPFVESRRGSYTFVPWMTALNRGGPDSLSDGTTMTEYMTPGHRSANVGNPPSAVNPAASVGSMPFRVPSVCPLGTDPTA
jgi:hypothetical protein